MKKWQSKISKFLTVVLLSSQFINLAPMVQAVENEIADGSIGLVSDTQPEAEIPTVEEVTPAPVENETVIPENESAPPSDVNEVVDKAPVEVVPVEDKASAVQPEIVTEPLKDEVKEEIKDKKEKNETIPLQLLGVNDFHGALNTTGTAYLDGASHKNAGKVSNLAAHLNIAEANFKQTNINGSTERIQAGDLVGASPANSALLQDEPTIRVFNHMRFTLGTLGNHEFDQGLAEFNRIMTGTKPEAGIFNEIVDNYRRTGSDMEIVIANVVDKASGNIPNGYQPYTIRTYGTGEKAVKVGYIGIITTEFTNLVLKEHHEKFDVLDEANTIAKYSKDLRDKEGVNAIVVISHLAATSSGETVQGEVKTVMDKVNAIDSEHSVDVVFAAHNHQYTNGVIKYDKGDVRVVQSTSNGKAYIDLQAELDVKTKDFVETKATVNPTTDLDGKDAEVQAIVDDASNTIVQITEGKLAVADAATTAGKVITRTNTSTNESPLGNLIVDAQLYMANEANLKNDAGEPIKVDFALTNNGGIRADLKIKEKGVITWGAAQEVQPFGNILQVVEISGKDLKGALGEQHPKGKENYFLQIAGLKMTYTGKGETFKVKNVTDAAGKAIKDDQKYNIVINDFLLGGGDGFKSFTKGKLISAMDTDTNTFVNYFKKMAAQNKQITAPAVDRKSEAKENTNTVPVQMLGVNDFHGALNTTGTAYLDGKPFEKAGKVSNLAAHLDEAEANFKAENKNGTTERIQAGDLVGASPANSALLLDEPTMKVFNEMKFTLGTLGNHEFDKGLAEFKRILNGEAPEPGIHHPIVDDYPRVPSMMKVLIANLENKNTGEHGKKGEIPFGFEPYTVKEYNGAKIGYIGIVTTEFPNLVLKEHHENFNVLDEAEAIAKYAKILREKEKVEAIVVISHLSATSSKEVVKGEVKDVMDKVNTIDPKHSVDVVFAAHNHQYTNGVLKYDEGDVRVVQSTSNGKAYIDLQGEIDLSTKDFVETPTANILPTTDRDDKDMTVQGIVDHASQAIVEVTEEKIAMADEATTATGAISKQYNAHSESALGNLVVDAQLYMANKAGLKDAKGKPIKVDFALTNNGGIRDDLKIKDNGEITWGSVQAVQPFGNILQVVAISGKDLKGALGEQHQNGKLHYFLQIAGLKMTYTGVGDDFKVKTLTDMAGKSIKDDQTYNIVINDFLLGGGDGFKSFTKGKLVTAMDTDTNTFVDYFKEMSKNDKTISAPKVERKTEYTGDAKTVPVQMLGVNDFHGALNTTGTAYLESGKVEKAGKVSNLAAHLDEAEANFKAENKNATTERIQAGDLVGASPANSALLQDEPTMKVFEQMKFTLGTLGNHEFDKGLAEFKRILNGEAPEPGKFNEIVDNYPRVKSNMDVLIANLENKEDGEHGKKGEIPFGFKPYTIKEYNGGKIGYIGIVTTEFPNLVLKEHHENFNVLDEAKTIAKYAKELRSQGVEAIVVISHLSATSSKEVVKGEVKDVMDKVNTIDPEHSVDVVFAGHNHQYTNGLLKYKEGDVRVVQSTSNGKAYIDLQGELDLETNDFVDTPTATVLAVTDRDDKDMTVQGIVDHASQVIVAVTEEKIAAADEATTATGKISKEYNAHSESALGNLVVDAQLYMANKAGLKDANGEPIKVDFALTNNGGIRDDLKIKENGEITWGSVQAVQPFGNILQVVAISGKDLKGALGEQHQNGKLHYFLQIAGLKMTYTGVGDDFKVKTLTDTAGNPVNDDQIYNIVINDFLLGGGDGFKSFTKGKLVTAMDTDTNTFVDYFKEMSANGQFISAPTVDRKAEYTGEVGQDLLKLDKLSELLTAVKDYKEKNYPADAWQEFLAAQTKATDIYERGLAQNEALSAMARTAKLSQKEIDTAADEFEKAKAAVDKTYIETNEPGENGLDLSGLKAAIASANAKNEADYTKESWRPFALARTNAEAVKVEAEMTNSQTTQLEIDEALNKLIEAEKELKEIKQGTGNGNNGKPKPNNQGNKKPTGSNLPKAGEEMNAGLAALGLMFVGGSCYFVMKRRKAVK